ncbi:MAG: sulfatase [Planctomycetota bacterium]
MRACISFCLVCLIVGASPAADAKEPPRNVLFIAADDLGSQVGCYSDAMAKTPNLDRLAAEGVCFLRAYNQIPLCNPSRASVMTGLRPDRIKVYDLDRHFRDEVPNVVTLSQQFKNRGHYTARVGKIYHYNVPASIGTDGFDDPPSWQETVNPKGRDKNDEKLIFNAEPHRKISASLSWLAADGEDEEQTDGMIATETIRLLEKHGGKPFFIAAGFFRPHTPYVAPKKYFDLYPLEQIRLPYAPKGDRDDCPTAAFAHNCPVPHYGLKEPVLRRAIQAYYASVSFIDAQLGRILSALKRFGLHESTLVVFWSDHGYHLGEHEGVWQKRTLFEEGARAPLIIRAPGFAGNGRACRRVVEFVDIYPTVVDWAGFSLPKEIDGRSLVPLLRDPLREWNGLAVTQILRPADHRLKTQVMGCSIRTARYRYTEWADGRSGFELYDHHSDPREFRNLAVEPDERTREIMKRLRKELRSRASGVIPTVPVNPKRL